MEGKISLLVAFINGFVLSLGLILPIGMQNGFILTQGALHAKWSGSWPAVVTASLCDTLLIALAVIGVSAVALHVTWLRYAFGSVGIGFLLYMGWFTWTARTGGENGETAVTAWTAKRQIRFTSSVSLLNPHALIDTLAVIGGSAVAYTAWTDRIAFGAASALVSWLWFFGLSLAGYTAGKTALRKSSLHVLNRVSAVMMWVSSVYLLYVILTFR